MFTIIFGLSIFCSFIGICTGHCFYGYKKNKSNFGGLIFWSILSLFFFYVTITASISSSTILGKLLILIIPISLYFYVFFDVQKERNSSTTKFFGFVGELVRGLEEFIDGFFNKIGFGLKILIIIFLLLLVLFFIIKLIKFFWFY